MQTNTIDKIENLKKEILKPYLEILENLNEVYIFGAKRLGSNILQLLEKKNIKVLGYVDNNSTLRDTQLDGKKIYVLNQINDKEIPIIIASLNYMYEIETQLKDNDYKNVIPFPILSLFYRELESYNQALPELYSDYIKNKEKYNEIRLFLKDSDSQNVLDTIIEYRKTYNSSLFSKINCGINKQYFEGFMPINPKVYVDGGAFDGDTTIRFLKYYKTPDKIYFIEPDKDSINLAKNNLKNFESIIEYLPCGISDKEKILNFDSRGDFSSLFTNTGNISIKCLALDDIVKEDVAFIKLDIEGAEVDAIKGARRLIKNGSPFAICVYHKPSDIWEIPLLIKSINPKYNLYLRHYSNTIFETVLYGFVN